MDICIGGPWNGAKLLKNELYEKKIFKVKEKGSNFITIYRKRSVSVENIKYTFWVSTDLTDSEVIKFIQSYF